MARPKLPCRAEKHHNCIGCTGPSHPAILQTFPWLPGRTETAGAGQGLISVPKKAWGIEGCCWDERILASDEAPGWSAFLDWLVAGRRSSYMQITTNYIKLLSYNLL